MKISISNLSEGVHAFHLSAEPGLLGLGDNFTKEVNVDVTLDKTGREVLLKAEARTSGRFTCDRCNDEFERRVVASYEIVYIYNERDRLRFPEAEVQVINAAAPLVDIADDVRQFLLLAIPLKLLCKDRCSGLCPYCGINLNHGTCSCLDDRMDPRWKALKKQFPN